MLHNEGLTFFTPQQETLTELISLKKKLEMHFWEGNPEWCCAAGGPAIKECSFMIAPSGRQSRTVEVTFHCVCTPNLMADLGTMDAVWVLADGAVYAPDEGRDAYLTFLRSNLNRLAAMSQNRCLSLIMTQIEGIAHISAGRALSVEEEQAVLQPCRAVLGSCTAAPEQVELYPVQVYGGLVYAGINSNYSLRLCMGSSANFRTYDPQNCHVPLLYSLLRINAVRETPLMAEADGSVLAAFLKNYFSQDGQVWTPAHIGGDDQ